MPLQSGQTESGLYNYGLSPHQLTRGAHTYTLTVHQEVKETRRQGKTELKEERGRNIYTYMHIYMRSLDGDGSRKGYWSAVFSLKLYFIVGRSLVKRVIGRNQAGLYILGNNFSLITFVARYIGIIILSLLSSYFIYIFKFNAYIYTRYSSLYIHCVLFFISFYFALDFYNAHIVALYFNESVSLLCCRMCTYMYANMYRRRTRLSGEFRGTSLNHMDWG